ncbi:MAG: hypothetical protein ABSF32_01615 [Ignavibacteria bacterium]|jgi:hypothetical protein
MIKDKKTLEKFERDLAKRTEVNYRKNRKIFDELLKEAWKLKVFPLKDPLDGIEVDIRIAKILNSVR